MDRGGADLQSGKVRSKTEQGRAARGLHAPEGGGGGGGACEHVRGRVAVVFFGLARFFMASLMVWVVRTDDQKIGVFGSKNRDDRGLWAVIDWNKQWPKLQ